MVVELVCGLTAAHADELRAVTRVHSRSRLERVHRRGLEDAGERWRQRGAPPSDGGVAAPTDLVGDGLGCVVRDDRDRVGPGPVEFCGLDEDGEQPELTPGMIAAAFGTIKPPPANLLIQPPNGRTLVNFETNFYTDAQPFEASLSLLGHQIAFRIRPATFTWNYGDGASRGDRDAGGGVPGAGDHPHLPRRRARWRRAWTRRTPRRTRWTARDRGWTWPGRSPWRARRRPGGAHGDPRAGGVRRLKLVGDVQTGCFGY